MVYTVFYKTSSFAGYCFLDKNSINPKRYDVFSFKAFNAILVKIQFCSFIDVELYLTISLTYTEIFRQSSSDWSQNNGNGKRPRG
jgi:hypothetical protein